MTVELTTLARAAYLRAAGYDWSSVSEKLGRLREEVEALSHHLEWGRLSRLARRLLQQETETEARLERRRALRSPDEAEASAAAEEAYSLRAKRLAARKPAPAPTERDHLARAYLNCLNAMSAEEFLALEQSLANEPNVTPL